MERLSALDAARLTGMRRGVEKESLRATAQASLALTPHPACLGSALTHPAVTTDFSESQLELITGVHASADDCVRELTELHQGVYRCLGPELMWVSSMPCALPTDETIPLGRYGSSNIGRAKSVYRMGLGHRYGRRMQTISGIHYNWSLPGLGNDDYFALIRNFRRHSFLLLTLFGASPALCSSFVQGREHELQPLGSSLHMPYGTSLRMGRLGYQSDAQSSLAVSYNGLEGYAASLQEALTRPYPAYEAIGVRNPGGEYNQLSTTLLQIENEFYGTIRPKRTIRSGERPLHALRERGVEYVEVRCMDLDPFEPVGISASTMRFLDLFLLHCWLSDSPPDSPQEIAALARNQQRTAAAGREPGLMLERQGGEQSLRDWGLELLAQIQPIAARVDALLGGSAYTQALTLARQRWDDPAQLPSARVLQAMREKHDNSHLAFVLAQSQQARDTVLAQPLPEGLMARFAQAAADSVDAQKRIEAADRLDFEAFRQDYVSPAQLRV
ncbi:glutamate--cysteine ligase [Pelomonas sp. CA6]|uniref:glutamate--cysteine ligase n=1 Tax=Pelomonas sp. CA6 TaxID=2907999 RepID=UPI001F4BD5C8|nr:glutamate--cysteine ligase [Pelomonas sp. CA6]MCH7344550.1 glutamate--cysteine ligase [Pelomonas sp. CA6]